MYSSFLKKVKPISLALSGDVCGRGGGGLTQELASALGTSRRHGRKGQGKGFCSLVLWPGLFIHGLSSEAEHFASMPKEAPRVWVGQKSEASQGPPFFGDKECSTHKEPAKVNCCWDAQGML